MPIVSQKKGGHKYYKYIKSYWDKEEKKFRKKQIYLGTLVDDKKRIYRDRKGIFSFDEDSLGKTRLKEEAIKKEYPVATFDFGDAWLLNQAFSLSEIDKLVKRLSTTSEIHEDILFALISYYTLEKGANHLFDAWLSGSYASYLYPEAKRISDGRVSAILETLGDPKCRTTLLNCIAGKEDNKDDNREGNKNDLKLMIDSTGLPNNAQPYFTAVSNHNGDVSISARLVFVIRESDWMPVYYRIVPGNIVDKSTLPNCLKEAKKIGFNISNVLFDAGYLDAQNMSLLQESNIGFITRMCENDVEYKKLVSELRPTLEREENAVAYNERLIFIEMKEDIYLNRTCYFYVCKDVNHQSLETVQNEKKNNKGKTANELFEEHSKRGLFVLISTKKLAKEEVLPCYYARQGIEQIFDLSKNESNLLPIRVHSEATMRGHVMLSFIATMISRWLQIRLRGDPEEYKGKGRKPKSKRHIGLRECYRYFRNVKGNLYPDNTMIISEAQEVVNEVLNRLNLELPNTMTTPEK